MVAESAASSAIPLIGWVSFAVTAIVWIGTAILWQLDAAKKRGEINDLAGKHLERLHNADDTYRDACEKCSEAGNRLLAAIVQKKPVEELDLAREQFCGLIVHKAIHCYRQYVEWTALDCKTQKDAAEELKRFIEHDVVPELKRFAKWIRITNYPELLEILNSNRRTPAFVENRNLDPFRRIARDVGTGDHARYYGLLDEAIDEIIRAGQHQSITDAH